MKLFTLIACLVSCTFSLVAIAAEFNTDLAANKAAIKAHVAFLADDLMEGRETGTRGYAIAARYVASQFASNGLLPGGDAASFLQSVPFRSTQLVPDSAEFALIDHNKIERFKFGEDFVVFPSRHADSTETSAGVAYAGYGVVAPHLGVDDYAGLDVQGKIVFVLGGGPASFPGDEGAHFSNLRLKQEVAAARGAIGLITLQTPGNEKLFHFAQTLRSLQSRTFAWLDATGKPYGGSTAVAYAGTLSIAGAEKFLSRAGLTLVDLIARADQLLPPLSLGNETSVRIARKSRLQDASSPNVVGIVEGTDAMLKHEYVVITSHLDHLGIAQGKTGDNIFNGALDNAMGVAVITEAARLIAALPVRPKRSIVFVALTGEEAGLLGSEYFVNRSQATGLALVANINIDMPVLHYDFRDVCAFGAEHSSLGELVAKVAGASGIPVSPDPKPERRRFTRSDQYSFVKAGIPAAFLNTGVHAIGADGAGQKARDAFELAHYHRVSDDVTQPINYDAAARFASLSAAIIVEIANAPERPQWKANNFFGNTFGKFSGKNPAGESR